ncbi:UPF0481 protein At3g47200-like [Bidens hawaiensis]|uniref:UPF0481 protein At3g47200-like n=1 Tax=Bidens hawaiensis TaxID=980011 RepID=UPI00404B4BA5
MKTLFKSEGLRDFVETDHAEASDYYKVRQKDYQKQDAKALFFIQQAVDESLFPIIANATSAQQAWSLLKTEFHRLKKVAHTDHVDITVQGLLECLKERETQPEQEDENLQASEAEKVTHVCSLLNRVVNSKSSEAEKQATPEEILQACAHKVNASIGKIRSCCAETINYNDIELAKMIVMDGCFILEFLYRITKPEESKSGNMMFVQLTTYDLLLLEDQIPFLVLEDIFKCTISKFDQTVSLIKVIHAGLERVNPFKEHKLKGTFDSTTHHILGLLHECYRSKKTKPLQFSNSRFTSAVELDRAGVNFKHARDTEWALMMEVKSRRLPCVSFFWGKPTLIMPELDINDFTELVLKNLIAYEQLSANVTQYITSYAMAMDMLIDTQEDIAKLVQSKVVVNHIGSNQEAASMINSICKEVGCKDFFYSEQWVEMNRHYNSSWYKNVAWLRRTYFNNPWNGIALFAGIFLFTLTFIQTFFTVYPAK